MKQLLEYPRAVLAVLIALTSILLVPVTGYAAPPANLESRLTDVDGFLSSDATSEIQMILDQTLENGINLYVAFTDDFSGMDSTDWCVISARDSDVPDSAIVYAVATEARRYALCQGPTAEVSSGNVARAGEIAARELSAKPLDNPSVVNATRVLGDELVAKLKGDSETSSTGTTSSSSTSDPVGTLAFIVVIVIIFVLVAGISLAIRSRRLRKQRTLIEQTAQSRLDQAAVELMNADDEVRAARDDYAFARAQFGELKTEKFADALKEAEDLIARAFVIHKESETAASEGEKHNVANRITELTQQVKTILADHIEQFSALRALESNVEKSIADLRVRIDEATVQNKRAQEEIKSLKLTYSEQSLRSILNNPGQASKLLAAATDALDTAAEYVESDRSEALFHVNLAQRTFGQAMVQIQEVMDASNDLSQAGTRLTAAIASISSDINDVKRLASDDSAFVPLVDDARAAIAAGTAAKNGNGDPLAALSQLRTAEDALDTALDPLRDRETRETHTEHKLIQRFEEVDDAIQRADVYVSTNRGIASHRSRRLIAEAKRHRDDAARIYQEDSEKAFDLLREAKAEAEASIDDIFSGHHTYSSRDSGGIDIGSLILGGILFGGGSSGGSSSSSWGSSSGWGSSGGFSGGFSGGGWSSSGSGSF
ncbi:MAG: hypothetical protein Q4P71_04210 [Actinomycetaceae bacterium]|nr:hypothetical protein [Actinomycetaceae bacterium]